MGKLMNQSEISDFFNRKTSVLWPTTAGSIKFIIMSEPYRFKRHWQNREKTICSETGDCPSCNNGNRPQLCFAYQVAFYARRRIESAIMELSAAAFEEVLQATREHGRDSIFEISRSGEGMQTVYNVKFVGKVDATLKAETDRLHISSFEDIYGTSDSGGPTT